MFTIVAMPLRELFAASGNPVLGAEIQQTLEAMLTEELGRDGRWETTVTEDPEASWVADDVGPYPIYALRAAAAWLELHDDLDGFEVGDEPWIHDALIEAIEEDRCQRFRQLLFSEAWVASFVGVEFETVYILGYDSEADDDEDSDDDDAAASGDTSAASEPDDGDDDDDDDELVLALGSLPALIAELKALGEALGMPPYGEQFEGEVEFDPAEDPLAAPRLAWVVLSAQAWTASSRGLPLLIVEEDDDDDELDDDELDDDEPSTRGGAVDSLMGDVGIEDWDELE